MEKRIRIDYDLSVYIERLFFEYNAGLRILRYLASEESVKEEHLDKYFKETKEIEIELELAKKEISNQYKPSEEFNNYHFDFETSEIIYTNGECCNG